MLAFIPFIRSRARWAVWGALFASLGQCLFGILGVWGSPANEGFGKMGPGIAALLTAIAVYCSAQVLRLSVILRMILSAFSRNMDEQAGMSSG